MYILSSANWFFTLLRQFFFSLDKVVFNMIIKIYNLLIAIARTSILSQSDILDMADRIYKLLAVFMIFKVTFSLIMYVVNPSDFTDKTKGVSKLVTNIVISLGLLILTPYIFNYAFQLQTIILEDNSLATLIFGLDEKNENKKFINSAGEEIAFLTLQPFYSPDSSITGMESCSIIDDECINSMKDKTSPNSKFTETMVNNYETGINKRNLGLAFRADLATAIIEEKGEDTYVMDYTFFVSTAAGIVVLLLLISFCLDVALRSIKLSFLQLAAPIPIISYVDPKSGKDGLFKKWYQMCFKTFLSLFIRLLALYFAIYIIKLVSDMKLVDVVTGAYQTNGFIIVFIIIGALMFAKQLPKMLEGLGIKLDGGGFTLNPLRKIEKEALGGNLLKKPNDALAKFGKGVAMAPFNGASLFGKKAIGAIDAARHGKGLKQGWNRTHGKLYNNFYKKLDEWAPDSAEDRKNERLGREEVQQMNTKWTKGKKQADKLYDYAKSNNIPVKTPFELLNGKNIGAYKQVYGSDEFIRSRMNLDAKDEERKVLQRISDSTMRGVSINEAIASEKTNIKKIGGNFEKNLLEGPDALINQETGVATTKLAKQLDDTTKAVSGMEKVHDSMRKVYSDDAAIEDQLKFVKYNPIDPTEPNNASRKAAWKSLMNDTQNVASSNSVSNTKNEVSPSNSSYTTTNTDDNVLERVEKTTGVNQPSTVDVGAYDPEDSALEQYFNANTSEAEQKRRLEIEERIAEINKQLSELNQKRSTTPDGDEWRRLGQQIKELSAEKEGLISQL